MKVTFEPMFGVASDTVLLMLKSAFAPTGVLELAVFGTLGSVVLEVALAVLISGFAAA